MAEVSTWRSWSGLATARDEGLTVRMLGSSHSLTDITATEYGLLRPDHLVGVR